jgi:hypothetical protein
VRSSTLTPSKRPFTIRPGRRHQWDRSALRRDDATGGRASHLVTFRQATPIRVRAGGRTCAGARA